MVTVRIVLMGAGSVGDPPESRRCQHDRDLLTQGLHALGGGYRAGN